ncbi:MAG: 7-carboxy-7-deazaguanine synthase QueE [Candidatus Gastranaerophilales bacterium]|nr:7-carboxy-7-deazaguanine synthase QueE [Candidatus Gastranaerophilales bacterium]
MNSNVVNFENKAKIKEIFTSVQGEGPFIGVKQIFIRFCACNLRCYYCDTDYMPEDINNKGSYFEFSPKELNDYLDCHFDMERVHSISLTGGEPLIWADFLKKFMPRIKTRYYLETNATIADNIEKIIRYVDIIAADIKLPSCSGITDAFERHEKFFDAVHHSRIDCAIEKQFNCDNKNIFSKVVFDENITEDEIARCVELARRYDFELILQPRMIGEDLCVSPAFMMRTFEKFIKQSNHVRLIPQVHKFIDVE